MWTDIKNDTNMGLQSTLTKKRKHEFTLNCEKESDYQSSCPPLKTTKWSSDKDNTQENENNNCSNNSINSNNQNADNNDNNNNQEQKEQQESQQLQQQIQENNLNENTKTLTKLEVVTATANDLWNSEPVDCISKLQAVAVPSDTWGSLTTRSTLATTLLSADEIDDDDDDFDDDYEEDESIIPTYCPVRYTCAPPHFLQRNGVNSPTNGANSYSPHNASNINHTYLGKPNYYSEPFPQQNCSRTINQQQQHHQQQSQHFRFGTLNSWNHLNAHQNNNYYSMQSPDSIPIGSSNGTIGTGTMGYTQQTIRCAENGKSYLELGSSTFTPINPTINNNSNNLNNNLNSRHSKKCGCDGRGIWCNSKNCYRDIRLKIRNLSMFKLSKFRQVSEQSLYRSVLICNTLKNIDKEIELENKDHMHHNHPLHMNSHLHHPLNHHHHGNSPLTSLSNMNNSNDFTPIGSCTKVCVIPHDHNNSLIFQPSPNHFSNINNNENECIKEYNIMQQHQQHQQHHQQSMMAKSSSNVLFNTGSNNLQHCPNELLHPYDHYPFREAQLGRATPFPMGMHSSDNPDVIPIASPAASPVSNSNINSNDNCNSNNNINNNSNKNSINNCKSTVHASNALSTASNTLSQTLSSPSSSLTTTSLTPINNSTTIMTTLNQQNLASVSPESDSGYSDDDCNRSINWSSVLSLSSQSALDPLNNNDLFSILPSPATPIPIVTSSNNLICNNSNNNNSDMKNNNELSLNSSTTTTTTVATNSTLTTNNNRNNNNSTSNNNTNSTSINNNNNNNSILTNHSITTLSTLTSLSSSSSTSITTTTTTHHHLESNNNCSASSIQTNNSTWEYNFLDMDLGIGTELTELVPHHCKLTSDDLFKSISTPLNAARYVHDNEIESPAHIMVGS
ncbi:probable cyclin-dependent serine/threonine-protein kinase DDB_G0292550 [Condylostylus longicornis]|uniref:probable cyclin-dependent serine/threonine-protein kinase DDB_G0292550 n=1 Tax=Condylostylus longicornis TaxID=2530218 RepID=UPI00244E23E4|nr:probable cyclin-dependent serine/threonine-protein kinase DDB_G0292550 [Condylostylus longicornis]